MPIVRIGENLVFFAHIPKCAGSSVENYLRDRFGPLAMLDRDYLSLEARERWTQSSPQHVDWSSLMRLFPANFFADVFAVVRHPVARAFSAYKFQAQVERTVPEGMSFSDWLRAEAKARRDDPHRSDNHSRPQVDFLPPEDEGPVTIFHLEHGLDGVIPYLDGLAGDQSGPRAMGHALQNTPSKTNSAVPSEDEIALVAEIYAADFTRLGYVAEHAAPLRPAPELTPDFIAQNAAARARAKRPLHQLGAKLRRRVQKWQR